MKILVTGASGFIGNALSQSLSERYEVICMSRTNPQLDLRWIQGNFGSFEDLRQLDGDNVEAVVHLAAVTGRGTEYECLSVNALGTRNLMKYLIDKGCNKFIMASSIAVIGLQDIKFRPLQLPIPDEHPCLDSHGYGFSKYMMEEITKYYHRRNPAIDVINLRLAVVCPDDAMPPKVTVSPIKEWTLASLSVLPLSQAIRVFTLAIRAEHKSGVRIMNVAPRKSWTQVPVKDILTNWWNDDIDLSYYDNPENKYASLFDTRFVERELGFMADDV